jgi:hypothetical protein
MKKVLSSAILLLFLVSLTACGVNNNTQTANGNQDRRMPDFGQPDRPADLNGFVQSVTGNEVTILKIDRPQRPESTETSAEGENGSETRDGAPMINSFGSGQRPIGGGDGMRGGFNGGPPGEQDESTRAAMIEKMKAMSSGSEKIIIPVGIQMLKRDTSSSTTGQMNMIEANLTDLTADKMIQVWLNQSITDKKVAEFVIITQ